jgi:hypothetical protein
MNSADKRILYAERFVWKRDSSVLTNLPLPPHLYELSSLAISYVNSSSWDARAKCIF